MSGIGVKLQYKALSTRAIRQHLLGVQTSIARDRKDGKRHAIPSNITSEAEKILALTGVKHSRTPDRMLDESQTGQCLADLA